LKVKVKTTGEKGKRVSCRTSDIGGRERKLKTFSEKNGGKKGSDNHLGNSVDVRTLKKAVGKRKKGYGKGGTLHGPPTTEKKKEKVLVDVYKYPYSLEGVCGEEKKGPGFTTSRLGDRRGGTVQVFLPDKNKEGTESCLTKRRRGRTKMTPRKNTSRKKRETETFPEKKKHGGPLRGIPRIDETMKGKEKSHVLLGEKKKGGACNCLWGGGAEGGLGTFQTRDFT